MITNFLIDLECESQTEYTIPRSFFSGCSVPVLEKLEINGKFRKEDIDSLFVSSFFCENNVKLLIE